MKRKSVFRRLAAITLSSVLAVTSLPLLSLNSFTASAKTQESSRAENVFFYVKNDQGKSVLVDILSMDELKKLSHGQNSADGSEKNYYISTTDNYPTTQYCEARGFTIPELIEHIKVSSSVSGADKIHYAGNDIIKFMATDSYGNYNHSWTYNQLYGVKRYYFEGLYDQQIGWKSGWETAGDDNSKYGISLDEYNAEYKDSDPYYEEKREVFEGGTESETILACESYAGRTTMENLVASSEIGLAGYITANGGVVAGCLKSVLADTWSLRLCIPMSEADLMSAHRTAYDNFKWIYNMELDMEGSGAPASQGTVAEPQATAKVSGDGKSLTVTMSCATSGASVYYSFKDAPQTLYTGPVTIDISDRNLESDPVTFYMTAVKEGWDDQGIITVKYPQSGVKFKSIYSIITGENVKFEAEDDVSQSDWNEWVSNISGINVKTPSGAGYAPIADGTYSIDNNNKTIIIDKSVFTEAGSYSFIIYAKGFSNKNISITAKKSALNINVKQADMGSGIELNFDDPDYQNNMYVYVVLGSDDSVMIPASYIDKTEKGIVVIKPEYFASESSSIKSAGTYRLEIVNNSYTPASQIVEVNLTGEISDNPEPSGNENTGKFADVPAGKWYSSAVDFVVRCGYFSGTSSTEFSPDSGMTRAMFVTVLSRMEGVNQQGQGSGYSDVKAGSWYENAVKWASDSGIVSGTGDGKFNPDGMITREQMAVILYNYMKYKGSDVSIDSDKFNSFSDSVSVHSYAVEAMKWASGSGVINGSNGKLNPSGTATRAQVAQIIMNIQNAGA